MNPSINLNFYNMIQNNEDKMEDVVEMEKIPAFATSFCQALFFSACVLKVNECCHLNLCILAVFSSFRISGKKVCELHRALTCFASLWWFTAENVLVILVCCFYYYIRLLVNALICVNYNLCVLSK